ncbi:hypothetical protein ACIBI4_09935 [Streptomyces sp. NPDC050418]|uniref:hypothetical protein n=1 Tax=Streptomyces sp. NPDC050418 TaxID=3365612 RepID=UPI0037905184
MGRGRLLLGAGLAGALGLGLFAAVPAAAGELACSGALSTRLDCLAGEMERGSAPHVAELDGPVQLGVPASQLGLQVHRERLADLTVQIPARQETGPGGTVLLLLADERRLAPDSTVTALDAPTLDAVRAAGLCTGKPRQQLCERLGREQSGAALLDARLADPLTDPLGTTEDGEGDTLLWVLLGVVAALLLAAALLLRAARSPAVAEGGGGRGRRARPRADPAAQPPHTEPESERKPKPKPERKPKPEPEPGPDLSATPPRALVRSALHPEGYVEVDHCLYRARWTGGPSTAPPAVGAYVDIGPVQPHERQPDEKPDEKPEGKPEDKPDRTAPHLLALPPRPATDLTDPAHPTHPPHPPGDPHDA